MKFDLRKHTVLLTLAGSRAYGTHVYNPDPWLLDIRNCRVPFDELKAWYTSQRDGMAEMAAKSSLPDRVDPDWLNELCVSIIKGRI